MPSVKNNQKLLVNTALIAILFTFLPGSNANAQDVSYKGDGVALEGFKTQEQEEINNVSGSSAPGAPSHAPAAAPKSFAKRLVWSQACTASALDRSGAVTGSTKVAGSDLHVAEMVDSKARNAAKTQACTRRAVDECGQRDDLLYTTNTATTQLACRAKSKPSKNGAPVEQAPLTVTEIRTLIATETKRIRIHPWSRDYGRDQTQHPHHRLDQLLPHQKQQNRQQLWCC